MAFRIRGVSAETIRTYVEDIVTNSNVSDIVHSMCMVLRAFDNDRQDDCISDISIHTSFHFRRVSKGKVQGNIKGKDNIDMAAMANFYDEVWTKTVVKVRDMVTVGIEGIGDVLV